MPVPDRSIYVNSTSIPPHRVDYGSIKVVWLQGTPYEMGYQHGQLLRDEIGSIPHWYVTVITGLAKYLGLAKFAQRRSFAGVFEECAGLAAATADLGFTLETYLAIALGDVFQIFFRDAPRILTGYRSDVRRYFTGIDLGCSQVIAADQATVDGQLYYGVNLDCPYKPVQYFLKHTTVFVKQPKDGIPHASISVPGAVWINAGINIAGVATALNSAYPATFSELSLSGHSHAQMMVQILQSSDRYESARALMLSYSHMTLDIILVADGKTRQAGAFELTGQHQAVRELDRQGILYATNHFLVPEMHPYDRTPASPSSLLRCQRFEQLLAPKGPHYGRLDAMSMATILRDRVNPYSLKESPADTYDDDHSIATNGLLRQVIFDPARLQFWVATGEIPVYNCPLLHFSLVDLLELPTHVATLASRDG